MQVYDVLMECDRKIIGFKFKIAFDDFIWKGGNQLIKSSHEIPTLINLRVLRNNFRFMSLNCCTIIASTLRLLCVFMEKS